MCQAQFRSISSPRRTRNVSSHFNGKCSQGTIIFGCRIQIADGAVTEMRYRHVPILNPEESMIDFNEVNASYPL